jgi:undecaprenyl-diphosphatase
VSFAAGAAGARSGSVIERLEALDAALFRAVNSDLHNRFFDWLMPILSDDHRAKPLFLATFLLLLVFGKRRGRWAALLVIPLIAISDQVSSNWLKDAFDRSRPCITLPDVRLVGTGCSDRGSMPSSHAANMAAAALHFAFFYRRLWAPLAAIAFLVGLSRVYVGVHYPADVLVGFAVGAAAALAVQALYRWLSPRWPRRRGINRDGTTAAA